MKDNGNGAPDGASPTGKDTKDPNPNQPTFDQMYLAERLDENLTPAAIVKLNKAHGRVNVLEAMRQLHGFPPDPPVEDTYGWLDTVASFKAASTTALPQRTPVPGAARGRAPGGP